jgi:glycosyltransferase involved in cell wall biosynthesis
MRADIDLVSVFVPVYNAANYISATLKSILTETTIPVEVIVVNDRSTDASLDRIRGIPDPRIRIFEGLGRGAAAAMNVGLAQVRGDVVMHCDADDLYADKRISHQVAWLRTHSDYSAVCGSYSTIDSKGRLIAHLRCGDEPIEITEELKKGTVRTSLCTYAIRTEILRKAGGFREYFESSYDIDMQLRLPELGRIGYVPTNFYFYRVHNTSITHQQSSVLREFLERMAYQFQEQRRKGGLDDLQRGLPPTKPGMSSTVAHSAAEHIQQLLLGLAWREHSAGQRARALGTGLRALIANPLDRNIWKSFVALALKPAPRRRQ